LNIAFLNFEFVSDFGIRISCLSVLLALIGLFEALGEDAKKAPANNDACFVCHLDFKGEELAETHAKKGVGCARCHGPSVRHINDESGRIGPDRIIKPDEINKFCSICHAKRPRCPFKLPALQQAQGPENGRRAAPQPPVTKTCVSCHGKHKIQKTG
jgi:hypothetical protein